MGSVRIPLSSRKHPGLFAIIDEEDCERVSRHGWHPVKRSNGFYAQGLVTGKPEPLHRFILGEPPPGCEVDHINGNGLDCRKSNLRFATHAENTRNRRKWNTGNNPYKGVHAKKKRWRAIIDCDGIRHRSRSFADPKDAAIAYDVMAVRLFGEFARLNFPDACVQLALPLRISPHTHVIGVCFDKSINRWKAVIERGGHRYRLGNFHTEEEASAAYQRKRDELSGSAA